MRNTKTECKLFTIPEWKKEEKYLREQHKKGWEFVAVNFLCLYHFKKCEPKDVIYQLDYNPDSVTQKESYIQMFRDCGWEYLQNYVGYSYFRKAASEMNGTEEEIFCDDASRLDMLKRVYRHRMPSLLGIFFLIIIPQLIIQGHAHSPANQILFIFFSIMLVVYLIMFFTLAVPYWIYFKSIFK